MECRDWLIAQCLLQFPQYFVTFKLIFCQELLFCLAIYYGELLGGVAASHLLAVVISRVFRRRKNGWRTLIIALCLLQFPQCFIFMSIHCQELLFVWPSTFKYYRDFSISGFWFHILVCTNCLLSLALHPPPIVFCKIFLVECVCFGIHFCACRRILILINDRTANKFSAPPEASLDSCDRKISEITKKIQNFSIIYRSDGIFDDALHNMGQLWLPSLLQYMWVQWHRTSPDTLYKDICNILTHQSFATIQYYRQIISCLSSDFPQDRTSHTLRWYRFSIN